MKDALAVPDNSAALVLSVARSPEDVLEEAHRAARALKGVIDAKPEDKKVKFNDEVYLEFEDWSTVGQFYGVKPVTLWTRFIDLGDSIRGWEARAEAVHVPTGKVVGSAEAMCLNDEEKWRSRPKYEWHYVKRSGGTSKEDPGRNEIIWEPKRNGTGNAPKKARVLAGEDAVPMFQLRSMAQTRAGAKAMRNALSWVVVLAGYRPTPAEEMPDHRGPDSVVDVTPEPVVRPEPGSADEAAGLFPTPEEAERNTLVAEAQRLVKALRLSVADREAFKKEYLGGADVFTADLSALSTMVKELKKREPK